VSNLHSTDKPLYLERVLPNFGTFLAITVLLPAIMLVSEPFDVRIGLVVGSVLVVTIWGALFISAPVISVGKKELRVGRAIIPRNLLGKVSEVSADQIFLERGPNLDPRAYKVFQGTVKTAIKITIKDEADPTPYWLISTRRPAQLATVLKAKV
jgi:hypothetical protein